MEIDTSNLTDEQISKLSEFVHKMEEENKATKWWIMPQYSALENVMLYNKFGDCYQVEPQEVFYSRSRPPLKTDFNSKEEAEKWLDDYLEQEELFKSAIYDIDYTINNLNCIKGKLSKHEKINKPDWESCFERFNKSLDNGAIKEVTKE